MISMANKAKPQQKTVKEIKKEIKQMKKAVKENPIKIPQPAVTKMTLPQVFQARYKQLCDETGCEIVVAPTWIARDDGTWSMVVNTTIKQIRQPKIV